MRTDRDHDSLLTLSVTPARTTATADALLVCPADVRHALAICLRLGLEPDQVIRSVRDGFLILSVVSGSGFPGVIRLRAIGLNLYIPVDARLEPALLDDERNSLARRRGMVILTHGRILTFDPDHSPRLSRFLSIPPPLSTTWSTLPTPDQSPQRLLELSVELPDEPGDLADFPDSEPTEDDPGSESDEQALDELLDDQPDQLSDLDEEPDRKPGAEPGRRRASRKSRGQKRRAQRQCSSSKGRTGRDDADLAGGKGLFGLGRWGGGGEDAQLRRLLQAFQSGRIEAALRHAPSLDPRGSRRPADASSPGGGGVGRLPRQSTRYSLRGLLESFASHLSDGRSRSAEVHENLWVALRKEYAKAAEDALRRGDFRRAAWIHGKLLEDLVTAASILMQAGLARDAAWIYLKRLGDKHSAARAFESARDFDKAVQLYREVGCFEQSGDLLRKMGDEAGAVSDYQRAAKLIQETPGGLLAAADFLMKKRVDQSLAITLYREGWNRRPAPNALGCAERLVGLYALETRPQALLELVDEVDGYLEQPVFAAEATALYQALARVALKVPWPEHREGLRFRARMGMARRLKALNPPSRPYPASVHQTFHDPELWDAALVSDASQAVKSLSSRAGNGNAFSDRTPVSWRAPILRLGQSSFVTAFAHEETDEATFLGMSDGKVLRINNSGYLNVISPPTGLAEVAAVTTNTYDGRSTFGVLWKSSRATRWVLRTYRKRLDCGVEQLSEIELEELKPLWVSQPFNEAGALMIGLVRGSRLGFRCLESLRIQAGEHDLRIRQQPTATTALINRRPRRGSTGLFGIIDDNGSLLRYNSAEQGLERVGSLGWVPRPWLGSRLFAAPLSFLEGSDPGTFDVTGLIDGGQLAFSRIRMNALETRIDNIRIHCGGPVIRYCLVTQRNQVAVISRQQVRWYQIRDNCASLVGTREIPIDEPTAAFQPRDFADLILINENGDLARVQSP